MNLEKLKKAEVVEGQKLGHPDDTYGGKGLIGSEVKVSIEGEKIRRTDNDARRQSRRAD